MTQAISQSETPLEIKLWWTCHWCRWCYDYDAGLGAGAGAGAVEIACIGTLREVFSVVVPYLRIQVLPDCSLTVPKYQPSETVPLK